MTLRPVALLAAALTAGSLAVAVPAAAGASPAHPVSRHHGTLSRSLDSRSARAAFWNRQSRPTTASRAAAPLTSAQRLGRSLAVHRGSGATDEITLRGTSTADLQHAVTSAGGRVLGAIPGAVTASVPHATVGQVQHAAGVTSARAPERAWMQSGPVSEGVGLSGADAWQTSGSNGSGVTVGIVDGGFAGLSTAVGSGDLPAGLTVQAADNHCQNVDDSDHGTAVAEIVHQMAPGATIRLYCIDDSVGLNQAAAQVVADGVSVVNCSLGFVGDSRGDGTGASDSAAAAVASARKAGVLWVESAGNDGADHWSGTFADADKDKLLDIDGTGANNEYDGETVLGTNDVGTGGGQADLVLRWDQWPASSAPVTLEAMGYQCVDEDCSGTPTPLNGGKPITVAQVKNTEPWVDIPISNPNADPQIWYVQVALGAGFPKVHYDLNYEGDVAGSYLANAVNPSRGAAGSIDQPADSPYVFAVGAAYVGDPQTGDGRGDLEYFSSQGPTIDGRGKPEITGYDGVNSPVYGPNDPTNGTGFYGTSASSPHVAGAAALVKSANTGLDAAQIQNLLEQRANHGAPTNPAAYSTGHGLLTLGATPAQTPVLPDTGSRYTPLTPKRILDTRTTIGGHHAKLGAKGALTLTVPGLPADATAVAVNLTGTSATAPTYLTAYPAGASTPIASNVNLSATDSTAAAFAAVTLGAGHKITIYNRASTVNVVVDLLGYFGTGGEQGRYTPLATPTRVLDTRGTVGGHHAQVPKGGHVTVTPQAPSGSTAAIVNIAVTDMHGGGSVSAAPACTGSVSTVNFQRLTRSNLAVAGLDANGRFCIQNNATGPLDIVVDVIGFIGATGSEYHALAAPQRIVDTRYGNGGSGNGHSSGGFFANTSKVFYGANVGDVPASAQALLTSVTEATGTADGYLTAFPGATRPAGATSTVNFSAGRVVANAAVIGTPASGSGAHRFGLYNATGTTQAVVDLFGYFAPAFVPSPGSTGTR